MLRLALLALAIPVSAAAEVDRCATGDVDLAFHGTDIAELSGDTGWFPSGSVAQLRLSAHVLGHTAVETGLRARACWPETMQATLAGRAGEGWLDVAYGADVVLKGRIHTSVLGKQIDWEGNIPLPVPTDFLLSGQTAFDPTMDPTKVTRVSDVTSPITLLSSNVIGDFISIAGISGGLRITVTPAMTTSFRMKKAKLASGTIDAPGDQVTLAGPFGAARDVPVSAEGTVRYEPSLVFGAGLKVTILGVSVVDWTIATVTMPLPALDRTVKLTGDAAHLPLPVLEGLGDGARMDFASGTVQELVVKNLGEAPLAIEPQTAPGGALISRLDIPAGGEGRLSVFVADPAAFANGPLDVTLATNDPDRGSLHLTLGREVGGTDPGEPSTEGAPGGCAAGGGSPGALALIALIGLRKRRRHLA